MDKDKVLAAYIAIKDCSLIDVWERDFHSQIFQLKENEAFFAHNSYESMWRAALLVSLIALRKVADFAENRGDRPDDLRLDQFGLDLPTLIGQDELVDQPLRDRINKTIAHFTSELDPDVEEMRHLRLELKAKEPALDALSEKFFSMI